MNDPGDFLECGERVGDDGDMLLEEGVGWQKVVVLRGDLDVVDQSVDVHQVRQAGCRHFLREEGGGLCVDVA